jgi:uncharacterized membrane protein YhaH (DUF805 family)
MSFGDAIGECFFNYANFRDRAARAEYWWWALFVTIVLLIAIALDFFIFRGWSVGPFYLVFSIASLLPGLTVTVRRLHDTGRSGWWLLIPIGSALVAAVATIAGVAGNPNEPPSAAMLTLIGVPAIVSLGASLLLFIWMLLPGTPGNNAYGPNRYAGD